MKRHCVLRVVLMVCVIWAAQDLLWAQQAPDTILYNGKIVTVDNHEVNEDLGTLARSGSGHRRQYNPGRGNQRPSSSIGRP